MLNNKYLKIVLLLGAAFMVSDFSIKNVFLANSPRINPNAGQNMMTKINSTWSKATSLVAFKNVNIFKFGNNSDNFSQPINNQASVTFQKTNSLPQDIKDALSAPLQRVSQGVYAGERNNIQVYEIKSNEIEYLVYTFTINGKETKIKVPKDQEPPSQKQMETLYK